MRLALSRTHIHTHMHTHAHAHTNICTRARTYPRIHTHIYIHTRNCTHTRTTHNSHTHVHTHTDVIHDSSELQLFRLRSCSMFRLRSSALVYLLLDCVLAVCFMCACAFESNSECRGNVYDSQLKHLITHTQQQTCFDHADCTQITHCCQALTHTILHVRWDCGTYSKVLLDLQFRVCFVSFCFMLILVPVLTTCFFYGFITH